MMIQVGTPGQVGTIEIQDLLFTVHGPTAGAVLVEWNINGTTRGAAGMWGMYEYPVDTRNELTNRRE